jgi:hypothetical protein
MHTTVEMVHRDDVENVIKLIYETILKLENNETFILLNNSFELIPLSANLLSHNDKRILLLIIESRISILEIRLYSF